MAATFIDAQVRSIQERREGAVETLVKAYTRPLLAAAFAMGFPEADAEELVQETLVSFLDAVERFEGRSRLKTYLFGILYNKAATLRRRHRREESAEDIEEVFSRRFDPSGFWAAAPKGPEEKALAGEIGALIEKCAEGLPVEQRAAFFLKEAEGESADSICNVLGVSPTYLRVMLFRARVKLRECLERKWGRST